jgi:transcriptional regulator with XRE-family HTH domain
VSTSIQSEFARRLRHLRLKKGWTQIEMAERLGIDRSYLSDMERGKKNVCLPTLVLIAQGFNISLSKLLSGL